MAQIIIIDDDDTLRATMRMTLAAFGHVVHEARNGAEGLRLFHEMKPDVLITDIVMPEMDGFEVLMKLRAMEAGVKVLAISGGGRECAQGYLRVAKLFGAANVLAKPFTCEALLTLLEKVLSHGDSRSPGCCATRIPLTPPAEMTPRGDCHGDDLRNFHATETAGADERPVSCTSTMHCQNSTQASLRKT